MGGRIAICRYCRQFDQVVVVGALYHPYSIHGKITAGGRFFIC